MNPISLDYFLMQGEEFTLKNLMFMEKDQVLSVAGAYYSTQIVAQMPEL